MDFTILAVVLLIGVGIPVRNKLIRKYREEKKKQDKNRDEKMMDMEKTEFIRCPICGNKTRDKVREDTILKNFPLFCPKCKSECLIDVEQFHISVIKAPDAQPQSR